jgi:phage terminase small subunit
MPKLTGKQERFVQEYLIDLNATQAATRAGYSARTANEQGSRLLANVSVRSAIEDAKAKRAERTEITQDYVLTTIQETIERCRQAAPVLDKQGKPVMVENDAGDVVPAYTFEPMAVLKGSELLGKHLKLFTEKMELTGKDGGPMQHVDETAKAARLAALMAKAAQRKGA